MTPDDRSDTEAAENLMRGTGLSARPLSATPFSGPPYSALSYSATTSPTAPPKPRDIEASLRSLVAPYRIVRELVGNADCRVFEASDPVLQRAVWLRVFDAECVADDLERRKQQFIRDAEIVATVEHRNVPAVYEIHSAGDVPFIVTEAGCGHTLAQAIRMIQPALPDALRMIRDVVSALQVAEAHGLVPDRASADAIWIGADDDCVSPQPVTRVLLRDFHVARLPDGARETAEDGGAADTRIARRQLAGLLYELLTARPLSLSDAAAWVPQLRRLRGRVPRSVRRLIERLLDGSRPPLSWREFNGRLHRLEARAGAGRMDGRLLAFAIVLSAVAIGSVALVPYFQGRQATARQPDPARLDVGREPDSSPEPPSDLPPRANPPGVGPAEVNGVPGVAVPTVVPPREALSEAWLRLLPQVPPEQQVESVMVELQRRNPQFDGECRFGAREGAVYSLFIFSDAIRDISPVRAFPALKVLRCPGRKPRSGALADISPLEGMPLKELYIGWTRVHDLRPVQDMRLTHLHFGGTRVHDLTPIQQLPLESLELWDTPVTDLTPLSELQGLVRLQLQLTNVSDLTPLSGLPIRELCCDQVLVRNWSVLRKLPLETLKLTYQPAVHRELLLGIPTLKSINEQPAAELLK